MLMPGLGDLTVRDVQHEVEEQAENEETKKRSSKLKLMICSKI